MAELETIAEVQPETEVLPELPATGAAETKNHKGVFLVLAAGLVVVSAVVLWMLHGKNVDTGPARAEKTQAKVQIKSVLHLETFVLNLADPDEKAYLRIGVDLGLSQENKGREGEATVPAAMVRDVVLGVLATAKPDELLTPAGKEKLKQELRRALRQRAPELGVEEIYFTEFLIQR